MTDPLDIGKLKSLHADFERSRIDALEAFALCGLKVMPSAFLPSGEPILLVSEKDFEELKRRAMLRDCTRALPYGVVADFNNIA